MFNLTILAFIAVVQCPDGAPPPCRSASTAVRTPAPLSVAVLPFDNRSTDAADTYLAEGVTEEITNQLSRVARLEVKTRTLVASQWRRTPDVIESGRRLNVAWLVHGSVRHAGGQLLVNVELIHAGTGQEAWASRFPRRDTDVFAVQAEVAESVAVAVGGRLTPGERAALARRPTRSNEAYRLYLLGNSLLSRRSAEEVRRAIDAYTEATRLDPAFAAAWARIALARTAQLSFGLEGISRDTLVARGWDAARRAMALDSNSAEVLLGYGAMAFETDDFVRARAALERAVVLDSTSDEAFAQLGAMYFYLMDSSRAESASRRALALNPDRRVSWLVIAQLRYYFGHFHEALAVLDTLQTLGPWAFEEQVRAVSQAMLRNGPAALSALAERDRLAGAPFPNLNATLPVLVGDSVAARTRLALLRTQADAGRAVHGSIAFLCMALGLRDEALDALERFVTEGTWAERWRLLHDPSFAPLKNDPRFQRIWDRVRPRFSF